MSNLKHVVREYQRLAVFKNAQNAWLTKALFQDFSQDGREFVLFTLKFEDWLGIPSIYRLFVECDDLTGYVFAKTHLGGIEHYNKLLDCTWFKEVIDKAKGELELKIKAEALADLRKLAKSDVKARAGINRYLLDKKWDDNKNEVGRPSKEAIKRQAENLFIQSELVDNDFERLKSN